MSKELGGWSMSLTKVPFDEFNTMMYGMVTNLDGLTTGTVAEPGWSPEKSQKPEVSPSFFGKTLWVYGGGLCSPEDKPANEQEVERIVQATLNQKWDGVDFDDECNMNIPLVIECMSRLKSSGKESSFGFISGYSYNHPESENGKKLTEKVKAVINSGQCDRLIHYCYASAMWSETDIKNNVRQALEKSIVYGMPKEKVILALTTRGLNDWNLDFFLDQIQNLDTGGLYIWLYDNLTPEHRNIIRKRLGK